MPPLKLSKDAYHVTETEAAIYIKGEGALGVLAFVSINFSALIYSAVLGLSPFEH